EVARTKRRPRAVGEAELRERLREALVHVPAAAAKQRDRKPTLPKPVGLLPHERGRISIRRPRMVRSGPVRVQAERSLLACRPRPRQPFMLVLAGAGIGWPHQRGDPKARGTTLLESRASVTHGDVVR